MPVLSWFIRPILFLAAIVASWFVARDAANFGVVQMVVALLLIVALVALAALWETMIEWWRERRS